MQPARPSPSRSIRRRVITEMVAAEPSSAAARAHPETTKQPAGRYPSLPGSIQHALDHDYTSSHPMKRQHPSMRHLVIVSLGVLLIAPIPSHAAPPILDPDWPCQQIKVPE